MWMEERKFARAWQVPRKVSLGMLALGGWPWKGPGWRVNLGEWKREKYYSQVLVNVVAALLDGDPEGNAEQLLGDRAARDIFFADSVPSGSGRFTPIPRHGTYAVNVNFSRKAIFRLCVEMGERCGV